MTFLKEVIIPPYEPRHFCEKPDPKCVKTDYGSVWACDEPDCYKYWIVGRVTVGEGGWPTRAWVELKGRKLRRWLKKNGYEVPLSLL